MNFLDGVSSEEAFENDVSLFLTNEDGVLPICDVDEVVVIRVVYTFVLK